MEVKLRLQRFGRKNLPFYRIVVASSRCQRDGKFLEIIGLYHPTKPDAEKIKIDLVKVQEWLNKGAQPTDTVRDVLSKVGFWKDYAGQKNVKRLADQKKRRAKKATA